MVVTDEGMVISERELSQNAASAMEVTVSGMVMEVMPLTSENDRYPTSTTVNRSPSYST